MPPATSSMKALGPAFHELPSGDGGIEVRWKRKPIFLTASLGSVRGENRKASDAHVYPLPARAGWFRTVGILLGRPWGETSVQCGLHPPCVGKGRVSEKDLRTFLNTQFVGPVASRHPPSPPEALGPWSI